MINLSDDNQLWCKPSIQHSENAQMTTSNKFIVLRSPDEKSVAVFPYSAAFLELAFSGFSVVRKEAYNYDSNRAEVIYLRHKTDKLIIEIIDEDDIKLFTKTQVQ